MQLGLVDSDKFGDNSIFCSLFSAEYKKAKAKVWRVCLFIITGKARAKESTHRWVSVWRVYACLLYRIKRVLDGNENSSFLFLQF